MNNLIIEYPTEWKEYELIDSGSGAKLERFGRYSIVRPDPRILWQPSLPHDTWNKADASFIRKSDLSGSWDIQTPLPNPWIIHYKNLVFTLRPTDFKHVGVFPEQAVNWDWLTRVIQKRPLRILNLFAYTGGATVASLAAGAQVTHVDSAKGALDWATSNVVASGLNPRSVRWICDDAMSFVVREAKRGTRYDGIIMDPPRFGRGSRGEVWKLEEGLPKLLSLCKAILSPTPAFILINAYTADLSSLVLKNILEELMRNYSGTLLLGELALKESASDRLVPSGIFARWIAFH